MPTCYSRVNVIAIRCKSLRQEASSVCVKGQLESCAIPQRVVMCDKLPAHWRGLLVTYEFPFFVTREQCAVVLVLAAVSEHGSTSFHYWLIWSHVQTTVLPICDFQLTRPLPPRLVWIYVGYYVCSFTLYYYYITFHA